MKFTPKTLLQRIFIKRVTEEMARQGLNATSLSKREGAPPQRTIYDVLQGQDCKLKTVSDIAAGLGKAPHELLREDVQQPRVTGNVAPFPGYPPALHQQTANYQRKTKVLPPRRRPR